MIRLPSGFFSLGILVFLLLNGGVNSSSASAAQLTLTWIDTSNNEDGFKVERKAGTTGTFAWLATVGANVATYVDDSATGGATYCYRVQAYNTAGDSGYSNEACKTATQSFTLTITKTGNGNGAVTSSPAGINCGATCSASYTSGTVVTLTATPAAGFTFAGWSGGADCSDGSVTLTTAATCTATFNLLPPPTYPLTVNKTGLGSGTITSSPAGLNCGSTCSASYPSGTSVTLTATPVAGSTFAGWSGDVDCSDGAVTLPAAATCTATFNLLPPPTYSLTVNKAGAGSGTITSSPAGVDCGAICTASYPSDTPVTLTATPAAGSIFAGWNGVCSGASSPCTVIMHTDTSLTVTFTQNAGVRIGVFRPSTGDWFLDVNGNGDMDDCELNGCVAQFGEFQELPVVGDWTGNGTTKLGVFDPHTGSWKLDRNGDNIWEGCAIDLCFRPTWRTQDLPVVGRWIASDNQDHIGVYRTRKLSWLLDPNGNGHWDNCEEEGDWAFLTSSGLPIAGDWTGTGASKVGLFDPATGQWQLDRNGNGEWEDCAVDICQGPFGLLEDHPVAGDWDGSGVTKIGTFDPTLGLWKLDRNGNGVFDGCDTDACLGPFGQQGDLPVVGRW